MLWFTRTDHMIVFVWTVQVLALDQPKEYYYFRRTYNKPPCSSHIF